ncbi:MULTISPECIES: DUF6933 domain-containing protein [unclassified Marinomonas]|uniref:DUF6933 domain-containing protein n=1 Tax=unclassified Marinomonas TaxID=196814 RepID=UPI0007AF67C4|nr:MULTISPECIES: hypothetical protein [unclassified Marinomonas]
MLVLNCTKAAADFFTVKRNGQKISPIEAPTTSMTDPASSDTREINVPNSVWQIHVINVQRKKVLIAMHLDTRYAIVFADIKKGDWAGFSNQLINRLFGNMYLFGESFSLCDETSMSQIFDRFVEIHRRPVYYQQGNRSVQAHMNDVAFHFENFAHEVGCLPKDDDEASSFDDWVNSRIRSTKEKKEHFYPDEEMFIHWMQNYSKLDNNEDEIARQLFQTLRQEILKAQLQDADDTDPEGFPHEIQNELSNIIDFNQTKNNLNKS